MTEPVALARTRDDLASRYAALPSGTRRAVVMTMGALHDGHAELVRAARRLVGSEGHVTVTVFVNPTQFAPGEDLEAYPRSLESDLRVSSEAGADLVFAPTVPVMYPDAASGSAVTVDPGGLGDVLEGALRPGHFRGVLTVVHKLLSLTDPHLALFGEKDYQQLVLIRRMVRDLALPVEVVGVPTVRDHDGLALSSRNAYLDLPARALAASVPAALAAGDAAASRGGDVPAIVAAVTGYLAQHGLTADYVEVTDPDLGPAPANGPCRLLAAVPVAGVRLLDNIPLVLGASS